VRFGQQHEFLYQLMGFLLSFIMMPMAAFFIQLEPDFVEEND